MRVEQNITIVVTKEEKAFLDNLNDIIETEICGLHKDCINCPFFQPTKNACASQKFFPGLYSIIDVEQ